MVADIEAARAVPSEGGVEVSEVQDFPWGRFVFFFDPGGDGWAVQQSRRARSPQETGRACVVPFGAAVPPTSGRWG